MKKSKKFLSIILVTTMLIPIFSLTASVAFYSGGCGKSVTWTFKDSTGMLTISGTGAMDDFDFNNRPWEEYEDAIKEIIVEEGVTTIGTNAFFDCDKLITASFSDSVRILGDSAFASCNSLQTVTLGNGLVSIGNYAFDSCQKLTNVPIPDSVKTIGESAFDFCKKLKSVNIPYGVTTIGKRTFVYCESLTEIIIPDSVKIIGEFAFYACHGLKEVTIPYSVKTIGESAFEYCINLKSVSIGNGITTIDKYAFASCIKLTSIIIPENVTTIGKFSFNSCDSLVDITVDSRNKFFSNDKFGVLFNKDKTILIQYALGRSETNYTIPESVKTIEYGAFRDCSNLESLTIPDSVISIGGTPTTIDGTSVYYYSETINTLYYCGTSAQWNELKVNSSSNLTKYVVVQCSDATLYPSGECGDNAIWTYDNSSNTLTISGSGEMYDYQVDDHSGFSYRPWEVFKNKLENVVVEGDITTIGEYAFAYCYDLKSIKLSDSVLSIGTSAFYWCNNLSDVYYMGTEEQWEAISINSNNSSLTDATNYYYHRHSYTTSVITPPTCTEKGYTTYTCGECGTEYKDDYVDALGHDYSSPTYVAPPCEHKGYTIYECHCGASALRDFVDVTGHIDSDNDEICDQCNKNLNPSTNSPDTDFSDISDIFSTFNIIIELFEKIFSLFGFMKV